MERAQVNIQGFDATRERHRKFVDLYERLSKRIHPRISELDTQADKIRLLADVSAQLFSTRRSVLTLPRAAILKDQVLSDLWLLLPYSPATTSFKEFVAFSLGRAIETGEGDEIPKIFRISWLYDNRFDVSEGIFQDLNATYLLEFKAFGQVEDVNSVLQERPVKTIFGEIESDWTPFVPFMERWRAEFLEKYGMSL